MVDDFEFASELFGSKRVEKRSDKINTAVIYGTAMSNSENGMVYVKIDGDITTNDGGDTVYIPTSPSVKKGDTVLITMTGGIAKSPMVTAVAGEGSRQDSDIASAAHAAQVAWDYADSAHTAATQAQTSASQAYTAAQQAKSAADQAVEDAATAKDAAEQAVEDAGTAYEAAQDALESAGDAATAAQNAQTSANNAATAASDAQTSANAAAAAASAAQADANDAKSAATQANTHANSALTQLSVIEDVAGTLDWISKHGTYTLTSDTTVQEGTVYFEKVGNDYIPIAEPEGNPHAQGWYTLDITDSQSDYIMAHLAVTSAGLWVLPSGIGSASDEQHAAGYKTLLSSDGMTIYDDTGRAVATYGEGIVFDSSRELKIGNNNAYIEYYDSNNDDVADSLRIYANSITLGGSDIADTYATKDEAATMGEGSGESVTVDSGSRLRSLEVEGKSVQDGTPSPSAPVPIQVVGGANMISPAYYAATRTASGITVTNNGDGTFTLNGTATATADLYLTASNLAANVIPIIANKEYRLLGMPSDNGVARTNVRLTARVRKTDESGNAVYPNDFGLSATFKTTMACYVQAIYVNVTSGTVLTNLTIKPQIAQSSVTEYLPYGSIGVQVRGNNMANLAAAVAESNVSVTSNSDGSLRIRTTANGTYKGAYISTSNGFPLVAGKSYRGKVHVEYTSGVVVVGFRRISDNVFVGTRTPSNLTASGDIEFTLNNYDGTPVYLSILVTWSSSAAGDATFSELMVNEGSAVLPYTPYVDSLTSIPLQGNVLASLPDGTRDELSVDASGHCVITKRTGRITLDGTTNKATSAWSAASYPLFGTTAIDSLVLNPSENGLSDRFVITGANQIWNGGASYAGRFSTGTSTTAALRFRLTDSTITTAAAANTWLESYNATFYYQLATPTTVDLGYITMPELADGCTVQILASLTPTFDASWYTENGAALVDFATKSELKVTADGITSTVATNYTSKDEFAANKSVRFKLLRDSWTESNWAAQESLGRSANWSNIHKNSAGADVQTGYDFSTLHVGDLIVAEGMATDSKAPHSILLSVETVPTAATGVANCTVVSFVSSKQLATRISQTESEISLVVDDSSTSSSLVLTSQAMDYIGDHVEIKGTDGTTTVISGGQIQTGSLTIGAMSSSTQADILNSNIEVGGTNLVIGSGDYSGWILTNAAVTKSGNILDINVSGQTSNTFYRGRGWLSVPFATLKETAPTIIVSVEVMSDDWSAVTSDSAAGFASASVQLCTVMGNIGTQTAGETKRYRYMGLNQTDKWQSIPAMENGKWLKFVSVPISVPDMFNADVSKGDGTNVLADLMLRRNGHVKWRNLKVEAGNKATAWSPAPEDYDAAIAAAQTTANTANERAVAYRGTNNTASNTAAKTIVCKNFALVTGATVSVYNQASNSVAGTLTLNVNGTGAKTIYIGAEATSATNQLLWHIGSTITYTYDGTYWKVADAPSNYYGTSCSTAAGTARKQTTIPAGVIFKGVQLEVPMQYANSHPTPTLAVQNANSTASNLENSILYGTGSIVPLVSNGYSWLANMSVIFRFDGQYWRTGNQTIIDGGHILTGTISADRIAASSIAVGKLTVDAQSAMLNSNVHVGGTNLMKKSDNMAAWGVSNATVAAGYADPDGGTGAVLVTPSATGWWLSAPAANCLLKDVGEEYSYSIWLRADNPTTCGVCFRLVKGSDTYSSTATRKTVNVTTEWQRFHVYGILQAAQTSDCCWIGQSTTEPIYAYHPKIEKGNIATAWSPAPEDMASAADSIEYIVGTQSAATGSWTGVTKESALVAGKTIAYRLPYAGSGNASLNLTLSGGGTTGAKAVYSMTTRVTTQYPANSIIQMTYDGSNWRTTGWYNTDTNARYVQFYNTIVAKNAIRAASIIGGDSSGYEEATAGAVFDLSYPIMWSTAAIAAAATNYSNIYTLCYDRTLATCYSSFTGTKNKIVYLVGTASGNKFTVDSSIITSTEPTEEDGKIYIPIGRLGNNTNGKNYFNFSTSLPVTPYAYLGGSFQRVDLSTSVRVSDVEGGLQMAVSDIATVTDTANAASDGVSSLNTRVNAQEETLTQVKTTFTFSTTGLTIGKSGSTMQSTFGNTSLQFKSGNTVVLELDAEKSTAKADRFAIGKYQLKSVDNGNAIAFVYVGG